jgi:hypothetical protein
LRLQVLIPKELEASVEKAATRKGVSKGEWVRKAIRDTLMRETGEGATGVDPLQRLSSLEAPTTDIEAMIAESEQGRR